jgi:copper transport protein
VRARLCIAGLTVLVACATLVPGTVSAHALLRRATPSTGQTLGQAPTEVRLLFSEPLDPTFSRVRVLNQSGAQVDRGDGRVDPSDEYELVATLPPGLPNGVYTVDWRSLSTIDVHPDFGTYPLFVGVPVVGQSASFSQSGSGPATAVARWAFYLTVSLFGGAMATWKLVFSRLLVGSFAAARPTAMRRAHRAIVVGGLLLVAATLFAALAQAAAAGDVSLLSLSALGPPLADLLGRGRFAAIWWPRFGLEVVSLALIVVGGLEGLASDMALAMVPAILLTSSLTSHGAALPVIPGAGIVLDWLHLLSGVVWIGGLASLALVLVPTMRAVPARSGLAAAAVARFSRLALVAAGVVAVSGSLQAVLEIGSWQALTGTTYGQVVLLKVALVAGMLGLAISNQRHAKYRLEHARAKTWFARGVRAELLVGLVVLAAAAVLTGTPPAR